MRFHVWHTFFALFFATLVVVSISWLDLEGRLPASIPVADFFLMALAVYRLVHLFSYDRITLFIREWFAGTSETSVLGTMGHLINCLWCTGLWFSFLVVFFYFATPFAWYVILILALSSVGSFLQVLSNLIGWSAEVKKKESQRLALPQ